MIEINLIPPVFRKNGQGHANALTINIPQEVLVGLSSGLVFILLTIHLLLGAIWFVGFGHLSLCNGAWQKLADDKTRLDAINNEAKDIKGKITMISGMTTQEAIRWSPKFNAISDAVSRGLWLRRMVLDKTDLSMEGSVVSKSQNEIANVGLFIATLKSNDVFMKDFSSLEVNSIQRGRNNAVEVTDFTVTAKLK